jgi:hypothetical protein
MVSVYVYDIIHQIVQRLAAETNARSDNNNNEIIQ